MVHAKTEFGLSVRVESGAHSIVSDVPQKLGGTDAGAGPHELLEASLAACTLITVRMYARRKEWPLERAEVKVEITKEGPEGAAIHREILLAGPLSVEQRERLLGIANKCPIHNLLAGKVEIETELVTEF